MSNEPETKEKAEAEAHAPATASPQPTTPIIGKPTPWLCCICQHPHFTLAQSPLRQCPTPDCTHRKCVSCLSFWQCCGCGAAWEISGQEGTVCWDCGHSRCTGRGREAGGEGGRGCYVNFGVWPRVGALKWSGE